MKKALKYLEKVYYVTNNVEDGKFYHERLIKEALKIAQREKADEIFEALRRKDIHRNSPIKVRTGNEELIAFKRKDFAKIEAKHCGGST